MLGLSAAAWAGEASISESWNAHFQATYVWQAHGSFDAPYNGPNSFSPDREKSYTFSGTAYFGVRPWAGGELYFNPEVVQAFPFSNLTGLGGLTNGENQKTAGTNPTFYRARLFGRQTWDFGGGVERVESEANQLAGEATKRRLVLTLGNLATIDVFDANPYAHDPRTNFLNWSFYSHGAYDFAADSRGYTWGAALECHYDDWTVRAGRFLEPRDSNGLKLDYRIMRHHGDQVEVEHRHDIGGLSGSVRVLAYRNVAPMGAYRDALAFASANGGVPDVANVRRDSAKYGWGINVDQKLGSAVGLVARASRNNGELEEYAFAEIDRSITVGARIDGMVWRRPDDALFAGVIRNGLSGPHRDYLAAGGLGFFLGDGRIDYRPEETGEVLYQARIAKSAWLSFDAQRIRNPGYNADRGPVNVYGARIHFEY